MASSKKVDAEKQSVNEDLESHRKPTPEEAQAMLRGENRQHFEGLGLQWGVLLGGMPQQLMPQVVATVLKAGGTRPAWRWNVNKTDFYLMAWPKDEPVRACVVMAGPEGDKLHPLDAFPMAEGLPNDAKVAETHPWKVGVGGNVAVTMTEGRSPMWFYDPVFERDYDMLTEGVTQTFLLSGVCLSIRKALLDDITITKGPQFEVYAQDWLEKGLVDGLKYRDEMEDYLCHLFGKADVDDLKKVSMSEYVESLRDNGSKKVAVLYAEGEIVRSGSGIAGEKFAREIAKVRADSSIKAVVFRVNSPGGEVVASEMIRREIEALRKDKPVIASYGDYAASGGYLISAGTDRIFVDNATLTGSIGVFGQVVSYGEALNKKLHIHPFTVGTHEHSDMGSGMRPLDEKELARYQADIDGIYDEFVRVVSDGRGMDRSAVEAVAQGRVWSGRDALKNGLADEKGLLLDAVKYAAKRAGLDKYGIAVYPEKNDLLGDLLSLAKETDQPMIRVREILPAGFTTVARMPYVELDKNGR